MNSRTDATETSKSELIPRVLFCVSDNTITSGAFRSCAYLAKELRNYSLSCTVLLPRDGNGFELLDSLGVDYAVIQSKDWIVDDPLRLNFRTLKKLAALAWNRLFAYPRIASYIKQGKIDIVHQNTTWGYMGPKVAMSLGVPVVWHLREFLEEEQHKRIICRKRGYRLIEKADAILTVSEAVARKYRRLLDNTNIKAIHNGIDPEGFYHGRREIFRSETVEMAIVGVLREQKGHARLLEALSIYKKECEKAFHLRLVGVGPDEARLRAMTEELDLMDEVEFIGAVSHSGDVLNNSDVAFVCSKAEAFGRVTVEAMMAGCVVIGANTMGTIEVLQDGATGYLYEEASSQSLAQVIAHVVSNVEEARFVAAAGQEDAMRRFTAAENAKNIAGIYADVLERHGKLDFAQVIRERL